MTPNAYCRQLVVYVPSALPLRDKVPSYHSIFIIKKFYVMVTLYQTKICIMIVKQLFLLLYL